MLHRAHGAGKSDRSRSLKWAEKQEIFQPKEMCFFLTSTFIEQIRSLKWAEKQENFQPKEMCFFLTSTFIELTRT